MASRSRIIEWTTLIRTHLPALSKPQATVLTLWSVGRSSRVPLLWQRWRLFSPYGCDVRSKLSANSGARGVVMGPRPNRVTSGKLSTLRPALSPCYPGSSANGRVSNWLWPLMPPRWAPASQS
jgi:hypothetical protein